jgi:hypothetical protein
MVLAYTSRHANTDFQAMHLSWADLWLLGCLKRAAKPWHCCSGPAVRRIKRLRHIPAHRQFKLEREGR